MSRRWSHRRAQWTCSLRIRAGSRLNRISKSAQAIKRHVCGFLLILFLSDKKSMRSLFWGKSGDHTKKYTFIIKISFLVQRKSKNKKPPSTKKGREHKLPRYHPIFMGISHNTLDAYNGAFPYTTTQFSLHPLQSERRYTHLRSVSSQRQTSLWQMKSYKAAFS